MLGDPKRTGSKLGRHASCRTPLHLESLPPGRGFVSWVMDSHTWQLHLTRGQKAQEHLRCVLGVSLSHTEAKVSLEEGLYLQPNYIHPLQTTGYLPFKSAANQAQGHVGVFLTQHAWVAGDVMWG